MSIRKTPTPEWARRILRLRHRLGLTQSALAARLHYSAMALSRWERGTYEPPAQAYIQIGNLVGEPESSWFWQRAGLKAADLSRMVPEGPGVLRKSRFPDFEIVAAGVHKKGGQPRAWWPFRFWRCTPPRTGERAINFSTWMTFRFRK